MKGKSVKLFVAGAVVGAMLFSGIGFASSQLQRIDVSTNPIQYFLNGKKVETESEAYFFNGVEYVPTSINYKGTVYVPARFMSEMIGKSVEWDNQTKSILISDIENQQKNDDDTQSGATDTDKGSEGTALVKDKDYTVIQNLNHAPSDIQAWVEENKTKPFTGTKLVNGSLYILVTRGEMPSAGYEVELNQINVTPNKLHVEVKINQPLPDHAYITVITYPYLLIQTDITDKEVVVHNQ